MGVNFGRLGLLAEFDTRTLVLMPVAVALCLLPAPSPAAAASPPTGHPSSRPAITRIRARSCSETFDHTPSK